MVLVFSEILDAFFELMEDVLFGNCGVNVATDGFMFLLLEDAVDFNGFELLSSFMLDVSGTLIEDIPLNDVEMMKEVPLTWGSSKVGAGVVVDVVDGSVVVVDVVDGSVVVVDVVDGSVVVVDVVEGISKPTKNPAGG